jgi:hypothetical protein
MSLSHTKLNYKMPYQKKFFRFILDQFKNRDKIKPRESSDITVYDPWTIFQN